ncbi:hypothetical protein [Burkholderia metallica]|uniref:hypothetical protein n=1 Tax=Burkholderia metallica TaxID=488729 RepID=UPI0020C63015|nr:hypothetical protein [Burkholderia metallica]
MRSRDSIFLMAALVASPVVHAASGRAGAVLATCPGNDIATATYRSGKGRVGRAGPHPEIDESGYRQNGLENPDGVLPDMAYDLINATMKP